MICKGGGGRRKNIKLNSLKHFRTENTKLTRIKGLKLKIGLPSLELLLSAISSSPATMNLASDGKYFSFSVIFKI